MAGLAPRNLPSVAAASLLVAISCLAPMSAAFGSSHAATPSCTEVRVDERTMLLDCRPGFHTSHDTITIYASGAGGLDSAVQEFADSVWLFDVEADGRPNLIIDFRTADGRALADVYDDQDGDGAIEFVVVEGRPRPIESRHPTLRVVALDGWWVRDGKTSFNLDILVDGPVRATFGSDLGADFYQRLRHDGQHDYRVHVRDTAGSGRPDVEWRQFYPPFSEDPSASSHYRTEIARNPEGDEVPITDHLLWPYLGNQEVDPPRDYTKGYNDSPAPIRVDWNRGRVSQISEFVASRGNPGNYFIYSINRVHEGRTTQTNFESPFAFYDLGEVNDGWPDMSIRFVKTLPHEAPPTSIPDHINVVQVAWDQFHRHNWTYSLNLVGNQPIRELIRFPEFAINAIPPETLPGWISEQDWRAATFVEVNIPSYWTSERVYEYSVEDESNVLAYRYLTGLTSDPPDEVFNTIEPGLRGEYVLEMHGPARLYFSPVDRRLHLLGATAGLWNLGEGRELRYDSLGTRHIRHWTLRESGRIEAELYLANDHLVYASPDGVRIGELVAENAPELLTPPRNHEEWVAMGELVKEQEADEFEPDDLEAMFRQAAGSVSRLPRASVSDLRLTEAGFELLMEVPSIPLSIDWLAGRPAGTYVVSYAEGVGFSARPAKPAILEVSAPTPVAESVRVGVETVIDVSIRNVGDVDGSSDQVAVYVGGAGESMRAIGSAVVAVPAGESRQARVIWVPPTSGEWLVQARLAGSPGASAATELDVLEVADDGAAGVMEVQHLAPSSPVFAAAILAAAAALAVRLGSAIPAPSGGRRIRKRHSA